MDTTRAQGFRDPARRSRAGSQRRAKHRGHLPGAFTLRKSVTRACLILSAALQKGGVIFGPIFQTK